MYDKIILEKLRKNSKVRKILKYKFLPKLYCDGYYNVKTCIRGWNITKSKGVLERLYNEKEGTIDVFLEYIDTVDVELKNNSQIDALTYLLLNVGFKKNSKENTVSKFLTEKDYVYFILDILNQYKLIDKELFSNDENFIYRKDKSIIYIKSVEDFIEKIGNVSEDGYVSFYRGHDNINYLLIPSIIRNDLYIYEDKIYKDFLLKTPNSFVDMKTFYEKLLFMQHYGLPTRLLDVTLNPLIALYFACKNKEFDGEVIVINKNIGGVEYPDNKNIEEIIESKLLFDNINEKGSNRTNKLDRYYIIKAYENNDRIRNQKGAFIIFYGNRLIRITDKSNVIFCLPKGNKEKIIGQLANIGIDDSFVYPEIMTYAEEIKKVYENKIIRTNSFVGDDPVSSRDGHK